MVTALSLAVIGLVIALAVQHWHSVAARKEIESLWSRTRDLHNMLGGLNSKHDSAINELKRVREFALRLQRDIHG